VSDALLLAPAGAAACEWLSQSEGTVVHRNVKIAKIRSPSVGLIVAVPRGGHIKIGGSCQLQ